MINLCDDKQIRGSVIFHLCIYIISCCNAESVTPEDFWNLPTNNTDLSSTRLFQDILRGYHSQLSPNFGKSEPVEVTASVHINAVQHLDIRRQILKLIGYVRVFWTDYRLRWKPSDYNNISGIILRNRNVWKPDLALTNSLETDAYLGQNTDMLRIDYDGVVTWLPWFTSSLTCEIDVKNFPLDNNICPIRLGPWTMDNKVVKLKIAEPHTIFYAHSNNGQFIVDIEEPIYAPVIFYGQGYDYVVFQIRLTRRPKRTFLCLIVPMIIIGLLCPLSFLVPPENEEKITISVQILLSTIICIGTVNDELPHRSDYISGVVIYMVASLICSFFGVFGNIVVSLVRSCEKNTDCKHSQNSHFPPCVMPAPAKNATNDQSTTTKTPQPDTMVKSADKGLQGSDTSNAITQRRNMKNISENRNSHGGPQAGCSISATTAGEVECTNCILSHRLNMSFFALSIISFVGSLATFLYSLIS